MLKEEKIERIKRKMVESDIYISLSREIVNRIKANAEEIEQMRKELEDDK